MTGMQHTSSQNGSSQQEDYMSFTLPLTGKQFIFLCCPKRKVISKCNPSRPVAKNPPLKPALHKPGEVEMNAQSHSAADNLHSLSSWDEQGHTITTLPS